MNSELIDVASLTSHISLRIAVLYLPKAGITGRLPCPPVIVGSEGLKLTLSLEQQVFSLLNHLFIPKTLFVRDSLRFRLFWTLFFVAYEKGYIKTDNS